MSDHAERKEEREEKHEQREETREQRHDAREQRREAHSHLVRGLTHDEAEDAKRSHAEIAIIKDQLEKVISKKDVHVHNTHAWIYRLHHVAIRLLKSHEDDLDQAKPEASWIPDALDVVFDADKQCVALSKAIVAATKSHTAKDADFEASDVQQAIKALQQDVDRAIQLIPDEE